MNAEHRRLRQALGAYALGRLDPDERSELDAHLSECQECRDELAALAVLPGLLGRLTEEEAVDGFPAPSPRLAEQAVAAAAEERRRERREVQRWRLVSAALSLAVLAVAVPVLPDADRERLMVEPVAGVSVTGSASMAPRAWGTEIAMDIAGLPPRPAYALIAVTDDGRRQDAAWWGPTGGGRAELTGACAFDAADVSHVEVTADGDVLARLRRG